MVYCLESAGFMTFGGKEVNNMYWLLGILGLALASAPFLVGYMQNTQAAFISILFGVLVIAMSVLEFYRKETDKWEYWVALILGVGTIASPFVLGFSTHFEAVWTTLILGTLIAIGSISMLYMNTFRKQ